MKKERLSELKEGLKRAEKRKTIISAAKGEYTGEDIKTHVHFYLSTAVVDRMRIFQVNHRKRFSRISHVIEEALKEFLDRESKNV